MRRLAIWLLLAGCQEDVRSDPDLRTPAPLLPQALDCGTRGEAGGLGEGKTPYLLLRHDVDLGVFPDALCNDGSGAVFYLRRSASPADANRWLIQLEGGGGCRDAQSCADRWCSHDTNFGIQSMSATPRTGIDANGINARSGEHPGQPGANPLEGWNQVLIQYCSSDGWSGRARDVELDASHPLTGAPVRYRIHFEGRAIFDAVLATLRRDGVAGPSELPDLDDAVELVLAGASAGGAGVTQNLDRLAQLLPSAQVRGLIDSAFSPPLEEYDLSASIYCTSKGQCDAQSLLEQQGALSGSLLDESCTAAHPGAEWRCADGPHVIANHLATPFFVRQGLTDQLLSGNDLDAGYQLPGQGPLTLRQWGEAVSAHLRALGTGEEKSAPGGFGPVCSKHDTLHSNADIFGVAISGTVMFTQWSGSGAPLVSSVMGDTLCP